MKVTKEFDLDSNDRALMETTGKCPQCNQPTLKKHESADCSVRSHWMMGWVEDYHEIDETGWQHWTCSNCDFDYEIDR